MSNNLSKFLSEVLGTYGTSITSRTVERDILTHPDYPSIRCISDALDGWKVKHFVLKVSLEKLRALDVPVIAHSKGVEYMWLTKITDSKVHFKTVSGNNKVESHEQFEKKWSGVAIAIEDVSYADEPNYAEERKKIVKNNILRYAFFGFSTVLLGFITYFSWTNNGRLSLLLEVLLLFVNSAGCILSYLLILQEKRLSNRLTSKFCRAGSFIDCNKVAMSKYSKLFGTISWSELGLAYFATAILWITLAPLSLERLSPLFWFLFIPLPFTLWSLFTQAFLIRKWCLFCCAVVLLLWINACIASIFVPFIDILFFAAWASMALLFLACIAVVFYICNTVKFGDKYSEQRELARIKYDFNTLQSQLAESKHETNKIGFVWGNTQSSFEIVLYVSIACSHCGVAVKELRRLTEIYPNLGYRLIFAVNTDNFEHKSNIITHHLTSLHSTMNKNEFFDMLDAWYSTLNKNLEALQKKYPVQSVQDNNSELEILYNFSQEAKIGYTPAILINGRLISHLYSYRDLLGITRTLNAEVS